MVEFPRENHGERDNECCCKDGEHRQCCHKYRQGIHWQYCSSVVLCCFVLCIVCAIVNARTVKNPSGGRTGRVARCAYIRRGAPPTRLRGVQVSVMSLKGTHTWSRIYCRAVNASALQNKIASLYNGS